jgi:hypothetical protein
MSSASGSAAAGATKARFSSRRASVASASFRSVIEADRLWQLRHNTGNGEVRGRASFRNLRSSDGSDFELKAVFNTGRLYF